MFRHLLKSTTVAVLAAGLGLGTAGTANAQHHGGGGHMAGGGGHMAGGGHAFAGGHVSGGHAFYGARPNVGRVGTAHFAASRVGAGHFAVPHSSAFHGGNFNHGFNNNWHGNNFWHGNYYRGAYGRYGYGYRYPFYGYRYPYGSVALGLALGYPYYGGYGGYGYPSYGYSSSDYGYGYPSTYYGGGYTSPDYGYSGSDYVPSTTEAAYPPAEQAPPAVPTNAALFTVQVPADAQVWIDGQPTRQTGPMRRFETPDTLDPSRSYNYRFTSQWVVNGQPITRERTVSFTAGSQLVVNLTVP